MKINNLLKEEIESLDKINKEIFYYTLELLEQQYISENKINRQLLDKLDILMEELI